MEDKNNQWNKLYENYINKEFKNWDEYFKTKMKLKRKFLNLKGDFLMPWSCLKYSIFTILSL